MNHRVTRWSLPFRDHIIIIRDRTGTANPHAVTLAIMRHIERITADAKGAYHNTEQPRGSL